MHERTSFELHIHAKGGGEGGGGGEAHLLKSPSVNKQPQTSEDHRKKKECSFEPEITCLLYSWGSKRGKGGDKFNFFFFF